MTFYVLRYFIHIFNWIKLIFFAGNRKIKHGGTILNVLHVANQ